MALSAQEGRPYGDINLTPLIDVMLVLLIIFIISIPGMTHGISIDNPLTAANPPQIKPQVVHLQIDFDGMLLWNGVPANRTTLQGWIAVAAQQSPPPRVQISVDRFAKYEIVAQTLADLQSRGLQQIGFVNADPP